MNWSLLLVLDVPDELVTVTLTEPEPAGEVAVIEVVELTVTAVAALVPNLTVSPEAKPVPVIVTLVLPAVGPLVGAMPVTVGAGGGAM